MKKIIQPFMYLHPCARLSVEYLHDDFSKAAIIPCAEALSCAAQLSMCEYNHELNRSIRMDSFIAWMIESVEHYSWCVSYYEALCEKSRNLFYKEIQAWRFLKALKEAYPSFPETLWVDPPLPEGLTEALQIMEDTTYITYRNYYLIHYVRLGCYRRVDTPFWVSRKYEQSAVGGVVPPERGLSDSAYVASLITE